MTGSDDEFDDFLRRRRPLFGRPSDDLEPPAELDRLVLRQAREAIESDRPQRVFRAPYWGMPVAMAATLVLAFTIILNVGTPDRSKQPEVAVQNVARRLDVPAAPPPVAEAAGEARSAPAESYSLREDVAANDTVIVDLAAPAAPDSNARARRPEKLADVQRPTGASNARTTADEQHANVILEDGRAEDGRAEDARAGELRSGPAAPAAAAAPAPAWRRDTKTWLAEIERLRAAGEIARADAELAEYKRQHRAYAGAPDR